MWQFQKFVWVKSWILWNVIYWMLGVFSLKQQMEHNGYPPANVLEQWPHLYPDKPILLVGQLSNTSSKKKPHSAFRMAMHFLKSWPVTSQKHEMLISSFREVIKRNRQYRPCEDESRKHQEILFFFFFPQGAPDKLTLCYACLSVFPLTNDDLAHPTHHNQALNPLELGLPDAYLGFIYWALYCL